MKRVVAVCVVVVSLAASIGCTITKQGYVAKGNRFFAAGKYQDAVINYRKAIQKDPNFGEAYYRLGLAAIKQNQAKDAYEALFRAVRLLPNNIDAKENFGKVCLSWYLAERLPALYKQITQLSEELLAKNPNSYEGLTLQAYLAFTDRKSKEAIDLFRRALQVDSSDPAVAASLAQALIQDGQNQEAEKVATDLIARQGGYGPIYDLLFDTYSKAGRTADAENILKLKVKNNPTQADYVVRLARFYAGQQRPAEMNAALQRLTSNPKEFPQGKLWVGDFYLGMQNPSQALQYYQEGAAASRDNNERLNYQKRAVLALMGEHKNAEALQMANAILKANPNDQEALHLNADLLLNSGKAGNGDAAIQEFEALLKQKPDNAGLRIQLGRAYRMKGDLGAAREQFQSLLNKGKNVPAARYELAEIALSQMLPDEALTQANEILKLRPNDARGRLLHARALMATGKTAQARTELTQVLKDSPQDSDAQVQLGLLALAEGKYPEAIEYFNKLAAAGDARGFAGLARAYFGQRQPEKARQTINEGLKKFPESTFLREQLAAIEAASGQFDLAISGYRDLLAGDPGSIELRQRIAEVYTVKNDYPNAIAMYQQAYDRAPNNVNLAMALADTLSRAGRVSDATRQYQGIVKLHPDNAAALNNLAFLLADSGGDLDEALQLAQRALAKVPKQPAFSDTVGYIYLKKGQRDSALQTFNTLVRQYPHLAAFRYHLGMALYEKGDKAAARKELEAALAEHPSPQDRAKISELLSKIS